MKDDIFLKEQNGNFESFSFDENVADAFDDMVSRSVPCYAELQTALTELALRCNCEKAIWDIGCSTGTTLASIAERSSTRLNLLGFDASSAMIDAATEKLSRFTDNHSISLRCCDVAEPEFMPSGEAGVVVMSLVLQFIRPINRLAVLELVRRRIVVGGCLLLVEKTVHPDPRLNALYIDAYHSLKQAHGYSSEEIARKRRALENRLIPFSREENTKLLRDAGFTSIDTFFTWLNFTGFIAFHE